MQANIYGIIKGFAIAMLIFVSSIEGYSQSKIQMLTLDEQVPKLTLYVHNSINGKSEIKTLSDYKGKWLILDFWAKYCSVCITSMPKLNTFQKQFEGKAKFLLIGNNDRHNRGIEQMYRRISKDEKLNLSYSFDSVAFKLFRVASTPYVVVIDPNGVVKSINIGQELSFQALTKLFDGVNTMVQIGNSSPNQKSRNERMIIDTIGAYPHQSKLENWKTNDGLNFKMELQSGFKNGMFTTSATKLSRLYMLAYFGRSDWGLEDRWYLSHWKKPVFETADTSEFISSSNKQIGMYNYSIQFKEKNDGLSSIQPAMQKDLGQWFGYQAMIENRMMPILKLVIMDKKLANQLKSKSQQAIIKGDYSGYQFSSSTTAELVRYVAALTKSIPIIDGSGINYPIDIELKASMINLESVRKALQQNGLDLQSDQKVMQVLVIAGKK